MRDGRTPARSAAPHALVRWAAPWTLAIVLLGLWWLAAGSVPRFLLPDPGSVFVRLVRDLSSPQWYGFFGATLAEALGGCVLGAVVALPLAVLLHRSPVAAAATDPFLGATQAVPAIAVAPLLVLWVGYGFGAIVVLCGVMVFFPILVSSVLGLRHVPGSLVDAARMDGAGSWALLAHIEAPLALASVLAGLRTGFTLSVTGAVVGEMVMGGRGLGALLTALRDQMDTAGMFATIIVLCVAASVIYSLIRWWEHRSRLVNID